MQTVWNPSETIDGPAQGSLERYCADHPAIGCVNLIAGVSAAFLGPMFWTALIFATVWGFISAG